MNIVGLVTSVTRPLRDAWARRDELGATLVEYSLLLALVVAVAIVALLVIGHEVANSLNSVGSSINQQ